MALTLSAKALYRWVWMRGQSVIDESGCSALVQDVDELGPFIEEDGGLRHLTITPRPDLTDEVTAACLPLVVRTVWKVPTLYCCQKGNGKWGINIWTPPGMLMAFSNAATEAEAWIAALEAAP